MFQPIPALVVALYLAASAPAQAAASAPAQAAASAPAQDGWRGIELPSATRTPSRELRPPALLDGRHIRRNPDLAGSGGLEAPEPLFPATLLTSLLQEHIRRTHSSVRLLPGTASLLVNGPASEIDALQALVDELDSLQATLEIELHVQLGPSAGGAPWIDARRSVRGAAEVAFGERRASAFLSGYAVDVASDAAVADPTIGEISSGETVHLRAFRTQGGGSVYIEGLLDLAVLRQTTSLDTGNPDLGVVQLPEVDVMQVSFSGLVTQEQPLVVELAGPGAERGQRLRIDARARPLAAGRPGGWTLLDAEAVASPRMALPAFGPGWRLEAPAGRREDFSALASASVSAGSLIAVASDQFGQDVRPLWNQGLIFSPPDAPQASQVLQTLISALEVPRLRNSRLELESASCHVDTAYAQGASVRVLVGTERLSLVDYDTELAPETWIAEPTVVWSFDGLAFEGVGGARTFAASAWIARSVYTAELAPEQVVLGRIQLPERSLRGSSARLEEGAVVELLPLSSGPLPSEAQREGKASSSPDSTPSSKPGTSEPGTSKRETSKRETSERETSERGTSERGTSERAPASEAGFVRVRSYQN